MTSEPEPVSALLAETLRTCSVVRPWAEQDEGPYHRDAQPQRRDLTEDRDGITLQLGIRLIDLRSAPLTDAVVEIWHCDALGRYSGFPPPDPAGGATNDTAPRSAHEPNQTFLRGSQPTDAAGMVEFDTIYPGWYPGRTVHIHMMAYTSGRTYTSQVYFPDPVTDDVHALEPYARRPDRDTTNGTDEIYPTGGEPAVVDITTTADRRIAAISLIIPDSPNGGH